MFKIQQCAIKADMRSKIKDSNLDLFQIKLPIEVYNKSMIDDNEITFQGKMYDIKSIKIVQNQVYLLVLLDTFEQEIINKIKSFFSETSDNATAGIVYEIIKMMKLVYQNNIKHHLSKPIITVFLLHNSKNKLITLFSITNKPSYPPPQYS